MKSRSRRGEEESKGRRVRPSDSCLCRSPVTTLRASCAGCYGGRSRTSPPSCQPRALSSLSSLLQLTFSGLTGQSSDSKSPPLVASLSGQHREYEGLTLLRSTTRSLAPNLDTSLRRTVRPSLPSTELASPQPRHVGVGGRTERRPGVSSSGPPAKAQRRTRLASYGRPAKEARRQDSSSMRTSLLFIASRKHQ